MFRFFYKILNQIYRNPKEGLFMSLNMRDLMSMTSRENSFPLSMSRSDECKHSGKKSKPSQSFDSLDTLVSASVAIEESVAEVCQKSSRDHERQTAPSLQVPKCKDEIDFNNSFLDQFEVKEQLGKGSCSRVYRVVKTSTAALYALKIIDLLNAGTSQFSENEILYLKKLAHPGIVQYEDHAFTADHFFILLEFDPSFEELFDYAGRLSYSRFRYVASQIVSIVEHLHQNNVLHRDLKPENFLIDNQDRIKLIDFDLAKTVCEGERAYTQVGTLPYVPPELLDGRGCDFSSQIWSCGFVLSTVGFGCFPVSHDKAKRASALYQDIQARTFQKKPQLQMNEQLPTYTTSFVNLICECLAWEPSHRPTVQKLKEYDFFNFKRIVKAPL